MTENRLLLGVGLEGYFILPDHMCSELHESLQKLERESNLAQSFSCQKENQI